MYIFREHRGSLDDAMMTVKEFSNLDDLLEHIVKVNTIFNGVPAFSREDISFGNDVINDTRIGWEDTRRVCVKRYYNEVYPIPQCIGWVATKYK